MKTKEIGVAGEVRCVVTKAEGTVKIDTGYHKNLILNQGLDFFGGGKGSIINQSCAIGAGNSTPLITQTKLDSYISQADGTDATSRRLSDSEYRRLIKARVIFNNSNCTANDLIEVANLITNRDDNSTQIMQHGLVRLKTSDETGILSYFVDRVNLLDNILPVAAGVRINLYEDKVLAFTSHPYPPLLEDKTDTYTASVKPLDITLRQILKEGFVDYEGYTPSVKPLDISLFNTLKSRYIDPEEAYTSSVTPLNITLRSMLSSTNQDPKEAYSPSVKPLDITLKEVLVQRWVDSSEAYTSSVKPLDITLIKG